MRALLPGHDEKVAAFVASLVPNCERGFENYRATGVLDEEGRLVGGMVFHNWNPEAGTMEISAAAVTPRWLSRLVLQEMFGYPFDVCRCQMVVMQTSERNTRLHRQLQALGLRPHPIPRLYGREEGGIVFTMTEEAWSSSRFRRSENGKVALSHAA